MRLCCVRRMSRNAGWEGGRSCSQPEGRIPPDRTRSSAGPPRSAPTERSPALPGAGCLPRRRALLIKFLTKMFSVTLTSRAVLDFHTALPSPVPLPPPAPQTLSWLEANSSSCGETALPVQKHGTRTGRGKQRDVHLSKQRWSSPTPLFLGLAQLLPEISLVPRPAETRCP